MDKREFSLVVAADMNRGIGFKGKLPWRLRKDMAHFRDLTTGSGSNSVIMGRKTWESIPDKFRPLPNRKNVVITRDRDYQVPDGVHLAFNLEMALDTPAEKKFIIGGGQIYEAAITHSGCLDMYLTRVKKEYECDAFFPPCEGMFAYAEILGDFTEDGVSYSIERWART